MTDKDYRLIENYMLSCMADSAHDKEHIYRVLYVALAIADGEGNADSDIIIAASLLHDIGRKEQFENPELCHAKVGAEKAFIFLTENGFDTQFAQSVSDCINSHRFRGNNPPQSIEAKILFDADKIDATGTLGIARTLFYNGILGEPLYSLDSDRNVLDGTNDTTPSFFQEYKFKLENVYSKLYTETGRRIAEGRRRSAIDFYNSMLSEVKDSCETGQRLLNGLIE
ncbi:MAG: HD domain-containing protein [Ruminococcaceae bacterium]|nr:HD domain-containing protein [Oscillospiraceae bacterium]